jgi:hypothetical protein
MAACACIFVCFLPLGFAAAQKVVATREQYLSQFKWALMPRDFATSASAAFARRERAARAGQQSA